MIKKAVNNLNSVLIEGTVCPATWAWLKSEGNIKRCSFVVSSLRYFKDGKSIKEQETRIWVMLRNTKLVEIAAAEVRDGRGVRIVGRLATDKEDNIPYIEAEHIEYRPEPGDGE